MWHLSGLSNITTQCRLQAPSPARLGRRRDGGLSVTLRCNTNRNMGKQDNLEGQYLIPHIGSHSTTPVMRAQ